MSPENLETFRRFIKGYFHKLSVLRTQIPVELRMLLLPPFLLYDGFKSRLLTDPTGRTAFEVLRERASRMSIKEMSTKDRVEQVVFGSSDRCAFIALGSGQFSGLVFTSEDFSMKYESEIPKSASVLKLSKNLQGVIELGENANFKFVHCSMYFIVGGRRFVKHIAFAWLFGNPDLYLKIDPTISAEEDFYSFLFSELQAIATRGFGVISPNLRKKTFDMYLSLLETVHEKFEKHIANTQADENESQFLLTRYKFFLEPTATLIESQISLVSTVTRKPDFHIQLSGQRHIYVEIEPPHYKPFSNQTKTARFEGALAQIVEWRAILKETEEEIKYLIIIGYDDDMNEAEKRALVSFNESQTDLRVITWNWILSSIEDFVGRLKRSLSEAP